MNYQRFIKQLKVLEPNMVKSNVINDPFADILNDLIILETYDNGSGRNHAAIAP